MKKLTGIAGITFLSLFFIVPVVVWAHGWGMGGGHMMGNWDRGPGYYGRDNRAYSTLTKEQQEQLADLNRKYFDETKELRDKLLSKSDELNELLSETNPDSVKARKLQKEISDLRAKLDEKAIHHEIEARKIAPDRRFDNEYGYGHMMGGYGMSYGMGHGMGYGMGHGRMGYCPGAGY